MGFWPGLLLGVVAGLGIATVIIALFRDKEKGERHSQGSTSGSRGPITYPYQLRDVEDEDRTCVVCLDYDANIFFEPCGHFCCCAECASKLKECPLCRRMIKTKTMPDATYKTLCQMDANAGHEKSA